jgi:transcriptional regulator with XRE-family HTH domain
VDGARYGLEFGRKVRQIRQTNGLSQEDLAQRAGLHPTHISLIETGKRTVRLSTIRRLAMGLAVNPAELMPIDK